MKIIIDDVLAEKNLRLLNLIILLLVVVQLIKLIFSFLSSYFFGLFSQEALTGIKKDLFHRILRLPLAFFDRNQSGYLLSRIGEVEGLNFFFSNTMVRILIGLFEFMFSLVILVHLNWKLTVISLFILPFLFLATRVYSKGIRKASREVMEKADIIIFDEAASHLDREGERRLMEIISERFREKTCLIISHRSEDLSFVDRTIRLERGRLKEDISNRHPGLSR